MVLWGLGLYLIVIWVVKVFGLLFEILKVCCLVVFILFLFCLGVSDVCGGGGFVIYGGFIMYFFVCWL